MAMNIKLNGDWTLVSHQLKKQFPILTENDLRCGRGEESALVERLSAKLKLPQEEIYSILLKLKLNAVQPESAL